MRVCEATSERRHHFYSSLSAFYHSKRALARVVTTKTYAWNLCMKYCCTVSCPLKQAWEVKFIAGTFFSVSASGNSFIVSNSRWQQNSCRCFSFSLNNAPIHHRRMGALVARGSYPTGYPRGSFMRRLFFLSRSFKAKVLEITPWCLLSEVYIAYAASDIQEYIRKSEVSEQ